MLPQPDLRFPPFRDTQGFSSSARLFIEEAALCARFSGSKDTHTVQYQFAQPVSGVGVNSLIRLRQWDDIRYVAIGYMDGSTFRHIKAPNILTQTWVELGFTHQDIIWQLQNGEPPVSNVKIDNIRVFVKGTPSPQGAYLDIAELEVVAETVCQLPLDQQALKPQLLDLIYDYLKNNLRSYREDANILLHTARCPMPGGAHLDWPLHSAKPQGLEAVNTYRFAWHAQHPAISLLLYAHESQHSGAIMASRTLVEEWLRTSYDAPDTDTKFTWYDHGTAERLLAFIMLWSVGNQCDSDQRFQARLGEAIVKHARLLASEAFYAYHQTTRYHNHAWFQDAALLVAALAFPQLDDAQRWRELAVLRFEDQLEHLIVRDNDFAVFVENSIGYHHGVQKLALWVGRLVELSGVHSDIPSIAKQFVAWSDFFRYPDGRTPAQGDTFRSAFSFDGQVKPFKPWPEPAFHVLSQAGYCVVKGNDHGKPFMLCMVATSLSQTHKHDDNLSVTLWYDGVEWLVDPSFYSHEHQHPIAAYLRSARAHNSVYLQDVEYSKAVGLTSITGKSDTVAFECRGSHTAYSDVEVVRTLNGSLDRLDLRVVDELVLASSPVDARLNFHLAEGVKITALANGYQLSHPASGSSLLLEIDPQHGCIKHGLDACGLPLSVAGQGFLKHAPSSSIEIAFKGAKSLGWRITALDNTTQNDVLTS